MGIITTSISSSTGTLGVTGSVSVSGSGPSGSTAIYSSSYGHTFYSSTGSYTSGSSGVTEISGGCVYITGSSPAVVITAGDLIVSGNCYLGDALTDIVYIRSRVTASEGISINLDNRAITVGSAQDLLMYHDGSDSIIKNNTGHILIDNNVENKHIRLKLGEDDSSTQIQVRNNSNNTVLKMDALGALSASNGITGSSLQVGNYGWTNSGILTVNTLSAGSVTMTSLSASRGLSGSSLLVGTATKYGLHWDGGLAISKMNANWTNAGRTIADLGIATTVDIRGGAIDGTTVGATSQTTGQFTSLSSSTLETARGATLGKNTGDRTRITGSFSVSGSVMGHQFFPTRHAYATTATQMKFIPFYSLSEANAPNNGSYINQMVVPFSGQLRRVYYRPSGSQNGNVSIALFKATNGNGDINMDEQGVLVETQVVSCANAASTTSVFNFTGSNHYSAGDVVGVSIDPNASQVEVNLVCLWEYNVYGL